MATQTEQANMHVVSGDCVFRKLDNVNIFFGMLPPGYAHAEHCSGASKPSASLQPTVLLRECDTVNIINCHSRTEEEGSTSHKNTRQRGGDQRPRTDVKLDIEKCGHVFIYDYDGSHSMTRDATGVFFLYLFLNLFLLLIHISGRDHLLRWSDQTAQLCALIQSNILNIL